MPKSISKNTTERRRTREEMRRQAKRTRPRHRKRTERDGSRNNQSIRETRIEFWSATPCNWINSLPRCSLPPSIPKSAMSACLQRCLRIFAVSRDAMQNASWSFVIAMMQNTENFWMQIPRYGNLDNHPARERAPNFGKIHRVTQLIFFLDVFLSSRFLTRSCLHVCSDVF